MEIVHPDINITVNATIRTLLIDLWQKENPGVTRKIVIGQPSAAPTTSTMEATRVTLPISLSQSGSNSSRLFYFCCFWLIFVFVFIIILNIIKTKQRSKQSSIDIDFKSITYTYNNKHNSKIFAINSIFISHSKHIFFFIIRLQSNNYWTKHNQQQWQHVDLYFNCSTCRVVIVCCCWHSDFSEISSERQ